MTKLSIIRKELCNDQITENDQLLTVLVTVAKFRMSTDRVNCSAVISIESVLNEDNTITNQAEVLEYDDIELKDELLVIYDEQFYTDEFTNEVNDVADAILETIDLSEYVNLSDFEIKLNYDLTLEIIESYEDKDILNDFRNKFEQRQDVNEQEFRKFCECYIDDMSELSNIDLNIRYIKSGGDESVFDEE